MRYDTLIIGAGLSGLAAGIRLAYYEQSVCILERHTTIGGLNSFYRLRGRNYDVGLHAMTNYARPGTKTGPLSKLLRQLRFRWDEFDLVPQNGSRIAFPGHSLQFTNEPDFFASEIAREFPSQMDGFRRLVDDVESVDFGDSRLASQTARSVLDSYLSEPILREMLLCPLMFYGSAQADDMDYLQFAIMFRSIFCEGFCRPRDGIRRILKLLTRKYKELGGELKLRSGVRQVLHRNGRAVGVELDDGRQLEADCILSSAGYFETLDLCGSAAEKVPAEDPAETTRSAASCGHPGEITFVETIANLDCPPEELGHDQTIIFYSQTPEFSYRNPAEPCDLTSGIICSPNNFQYPQPLGENAIRITALANKDYWMRREPDEYQADKKLWHDRMVEAALPYLPDFRPHVIDVDTFTPRTIRRFTGHWNGCVYGAPQKRWDGRTPVEGLYIIGTDQGYLGIVGSMLSGISMANMHALKTGA